MAKQEKTFAKTNRRSGDCSSQKGRWPGHMSISLIFTSSSGYNKLVFPFFRVNPCTHVVLWAKWFAQWLYCWPSSYLEQCIVPQNFELLPFLYFSFVRVLKFITHRKYAFFCIYYVRLSLDNHNLIHWIQFDHVLL